MKKKLQVKQAELREVMEAFNMLQEKLAQTREHRMQLESDIAEC